MTKDKVEELKEKFDTLIELGVVFRYGSEDIEQGEITNIEFTEDDTVKLELDEFTEEEVDDVICFSLSENKKAYSFETLYVNREELKRTDYKKTRKIFSKTRSKK